MGPALIEPDHKFLIGEICLLKLAAMGPALIEPDHGQASRLRIDPGLLAAMGPALIEPDHTTMDELVAHLVDTPQWGRLSSSRITLPTSRRPREGGPPQWGRLSSSRITGKMSLSRAVKFTPQWGRLSSSRITGVLPGRADPRRRRNGA